MADNINFPQNNIRPNVADVAKRELARRQQNPEPQQKLLKPARAEENYIPADETIFTLVRNALSALKQGTVFDRGSIVNLVV